MEDSDLKGDKIQVGWMSQYIGVSYARRLFELFLGVNVGPPLIGEWLLERFPTVWEPATREGTSFFLTHNSLRLYSGLARNQSPIDIHGRQRGDSHEPA